MSDRSKRRKRERDRTPIPGMEKRLQKILDRLDTLESYRFRNDTEGSTTTPSARWAHDGAIAAAAVASGEPPPPIAVSTNVESSDASLNLSVPCSSATINDSGTGVLNEVAEKIANAIGAIPVRSNHIFVSSFDPSLHDFNLWCHEVDHLKQTNRWDDLECLARVGNCLKGDAKLWLNEWVSNDRSWSNFKREFKTLCPKRLDIANILFDIMKSDSDNYPTYAEYARRSLLRLRIVNGLSDELIAAIVIRGITDTQIRAAATNAKLLPDDLVNFLSIYTKPTRITSVCSTDLIYKTTTRKREHVVTKIKCFSCGAFGHIQMTCPKSVKLDRTNANNSPLVATNSDKLSQRAETCSFCKKVGHKVDDCFSKQRAEFRGNSN